MPGQSNCFKESWLKNSDSNGHKLSTYVKQKDLHSITCVACDTIVKINRGCASIYQHSKGDRHKNNMVVKLSNNQLKISNGDGGVTYFNKKEDVLKSEIIWALRCVQYNHSFQSNDGIKDVFRLMFPECEVAQQFTMSAKKTKYLITFGLAPYFKERLKDDMSGKYI